MQLLCTVYIVALNVILAGFSDATVTVLGLYYKVQTFFFIPLMGLQQVIVPIISFNYGAQNHKRVSDTLKYAIMASNMVMILGTVIFLAFPAELISIFSVSPSILNIGIPALQIISISFVPASFSMMFTVYFQGMNQGRYSIFITVLRQIILLVPLAWLFHFAGVNYVWLTFPVTEIIAMCFCFFLFQRKAYNLSLR